MIGLKNISKSYGNFRALRNVTVAFETGRMTALLGPNGSGKTTIIKSLLGLVKPDEGSVEWNGMHVNGDWEFREDIGYMPQIAHYPENLTIMEFLSMIVDIRRTAPSRLEEMMRVFDLTGLERKPMKGLSGGTRQRVCAVMALMFDVPMYILDEPTAGLDPLMSRRLKDVLSAEKEKGKTILFTSHVMSDIEELADRIVFLLDGSIVFDGGIDTLFERTGMSSVERAIAAFMEGEEIEKGSVG